MENLDDYKTGKKLWVRGTMDKLTGNFINKWSNFWLFQKERKELDKAFEKELNDIIKQESDQALKDMEGRMKDIINFTISRWATLNERAQPDHKQVRENWYNGEFQEFLNSLKDKTEKSHGIWNFLDKDKYDEHFNH